MSSKFPWKIVNSWQVLLQFCYVRVHLKLFSYLIGLILQDSDLFWHQNRKSFPDPDGNLWASNRSTYSYNLLFQSDSSPASEALQLILTESAGDPKERWSCAFLTVSMLVNSLCSLFQLSCPIAAVRQSTHIVHCPCFASQSYFFIHSLVSVVHLKNFISKKCWYLKSKWDSLSVAFQFLSDPFCGSVNFSYECGSNLDVFL